MSQLLPERSGNYQTERWNPFAELEQVNERMRRVLEQTFGELISEAGAWTPSVDIEEEDDAYVIEADAPGVKREDVNIEVIGREVAITGEIKERQRNGVVRRRTRRAGRFEYRVALPTDVDPEQVDAKLKDGVLTIRIPKAQGDQRRRIEVKS